MVNGKKIKIILGSVIISFAIFVSGIYYFSVSRLVVTKNLDLVYLGEDFFSFSPQCIRYLWLRKWLNDKHLTEFRQRVAIRAVRYGVGDTSGRWSARCSKSLNEMLLKKLKSDNLYIVDDAILVYFFNKLTPNQQVLDELYRLNEKYRKNYTLDDRMHYPEDYKCSIYKASSIILIRYDTDTAIKRNIMKDYCNLVE